MHRVSSGGQSARRRGEGRRGRRLTPAMTRRVPYSVEQLLGGVGARGIEYTTEPEDMGHMGQERT